MWKKDDVKTPGVSESSPSAVNPPAAVNPNPSQASQRDQASQREMTTPPQRTAPASGNASGSASVSQGIRIRGEITGSENLYIDGQIEGKLDLGNASVTVGPNGVVKADVTAREVIVRGRVDGKVVGSERIQIASSGQIIGEIHCERIAIEDGAVLRGKVETGRPLAKPAEARVVAAGASGGNKNSDAQRQATAATPANAATAGTTTE
jgi:cytoskeletal protein CcmA (bactofilin family)